VYFLSKQKTPPPEPSPDEINFGFFLLFYNSCVFASMTCWYFLSKQKTPPPEKPLDLLSDEI
jgi:hypothetical protein